MLADGAFCSSYRNKTFAARVAWRAYKFSKCPFGSKADMCAAKRHVCFTPNSDRESEIPQKAMSAVPPRADMCGATRDVRFGPKADTDILFDHLVGACEHRMRYF